MANKKSSKKRIVQTAVKNTRNSMVRSACRTAEKSLRTLVLANNKEEASKAFATAEKKFTSAASKGIYHKNTVARKISRLSKLLTKVA